MANGLILESVCKRFENGSMGLADVSLTLAIGKRLSILGPSGSGKTTLLRLLVGLENPDTGRVIFNGRCLNNVPAHKRNFGMMFQEFALFPHMNVYENIAFGLKIKKMPPSLLKKRVEEMLSLTGLSGFEKREVDDLSGGERQRVALARALAPSPDLLMLDEPFSSLDRNLRKHLLSELIQIICELNMTAVFVTHDHTEAFHFGDTVMVLRNGQVVQEGTPQEISERPSSKWVRSFLGVK